MSLETMTKLATTTVGVGGISSITFSNIPQGYTDLKILLSARTSASSTQDNLMIKFNGSSTGYTYRFLNSSGSSRSTSSGTDSATTLVTANTATANVFSNTEFYIRNYAQNVYKSYSAETVTENNATTAYIEIWSHLWSNSSPITSIALTSAGSSNFLQHTTATLYGIKNARQTLANSIKATGGQISFDGTYVSHIFTSSGLFTPTQPIVADYLVVAGGGAGSGNSGGGGGAGGMRCTVDGTGGSGSLESKLNLSSNTNYAVTVGAGGASALATNNLRGNNGSDSAFANIISLGGGGGGNRLGGSPIGNGAVGGSGGGGAVDGYTGGAGTSGQGFAGGASPGAANPGAGGGGASAVGRDGGSTDTTGGSGGAGRATSISGASVFYAGGGAGGYNIAGSSQGGIGGGASAPTVNNTAGNPGINNTGGGGSGGTGAFDGNNGGRGGSGIVVIRYKG